MRQLLDTHSFIWFVTGSLRITPEIRFKIENNDNLLSMASVWEIAIKLNLGKLDLGMTIETLVKQQVTGNGIELLTITMEHLSIISILPLHHRDPFDRLLIAQAMVEGIPIVSADVAFDAYVIERSW